MEIKTCEEYVINELKIALEKIEHLEGENDQFRNTIKYASGIINLFKDIAVLEDAGDGRRYELKLKNSKGMCIDLSAEGGKKAFEYLAPLLIPGYVKETRKEKKAAMKELREAEGE